MPIKDFLPPLEEQLDGTWSLWAVQCNRSVKTGDITTVVLGLCAPGGAQQPKAIETCDLRSKTTLASPLLRRALQRQDLTPMPLTKR
jgi:hypothetical protein